MIRIREGVSRGEALDQLMSMMANYVGRGLLDLILSAALSLAFLWFLIPLAQRVNLIDRPRGRKDHAAPTAAVGGLAMTCSVFLMIVLFSKLAPVMVSFMASAGLIVLIGALDDRYDLRWWQRVLAQCAAVLVMIHWGGVYVAHLGNLVGVQSLGLGALAVPFTMFATVGVINAVNMSDGVDGLAGGVALASLCMMESAAIYSGNIGLAQSILFFIGAVSGFLLMNMRFPWQPRARVFMGDSGSALLGFALAWVSFRLTQNTAHPVSPVLPVWFVATPVIDCLSLIARRLMKRQSPFSADREHMHHLLLDSGFSPGQVSLALIGVNLALGLSASIALLIKVPQPILASAFVGLCVGYFCLTARRDRALKVFRHIHGFLIRSGQKPKTDISRSLASDVHTLEKQ